MDFIQLNNFNDGREQRTPMNSRMGSIPMPMADGGFAMPQAKYNVDATTTARSTRLQTCNCFEDMPLAMAYVPMQTWRDVYDSSVGFSRGTIFAQLDKPFIGEGVK